MRYISIMNQKGMMKRIGWKDKIFDRKKEQKVPLNSYVTKTVKNSFQFNIIISKDDE